MLYNQNWTQQIIFHMFHSPLAQPLIACCWDSPSDCHPLGFSNRLSSVGILQQTVIRWILHQTVIRWDSPTDSHPFGFSNRQSSVWILQQTVIRWDSPTDCHPLGFCNRLSWAGILQQTVVPWDSVTDMIPQCISRRGYRDFCTMVNPKFHSIIYYSTGVQIVSCTLSDDSVLSESTGLNNICVSQWNLFRQKKSANEIVSFKSG